jgi:SIR2-like domain
MSAHNVPVFLPRRGGPAVVTCDRPPASDWVKRVVGEFEPRAVLFVWYNRGNWAASMVSGGGPGVPRRKDLELAAGVLAGDGSLSRGDEVVFRREPGVAPERVVVPTGNVTGKRDEVLTPAGMDAWIKRRNVKNVRQIVESLRSAMGVIPFLGAGMSYDFEYPLWGPFFTQFGADAADGTIVASRKLSAEKQAEVIAFIKDQKFEKAADILVKWNKAAFYARVKQKFGREPNLGADTSLTRLPQIAPGPIITTNFDPVIEAVYKKAGRPFSDDRRILGGRSYPQLVVTALQQNWNALIKLHGDAQEPRSLVFTGIEYEKGYGDIDNPGPVERLATVIYTNRPLLFLGCSLETDRTLASLENVYKRNHYVGHYAVLAGYFRTSRRDERLSRLEAAGIRPLWYHPGQHGDIAVLLDALVRRTAVDELPVSRTSRRAAVPSGVSAVGTIQSSKAKSGRWRDLTDRRIKSVADRLIDGKLVFFVGSAVHSRRMHGQQFYEVLWQQTGIEWPTVDRTDVAQYLADLDRDKLSKLCTRLINTHYAVPDKTHHYLAALSRRLRPLGHAPLMILTTNYDYAMEAAFDAAGEPYHLFVYNHSGPYAGRFLHRDPDGHEFAIRTPAAIGGPLKDPAIIKLNGGVDLLRRWQETFVVASSDFEELSTRIPDVVPQVVWEALLTRAMLFLGHGLREPDVRSLIRRRHREHAPTSWALQLPKADTKFWRAAGVELIEADITAFLSRLESALASRGI